MTPLISHKLHNWMTRWFLNNELRVLWKEAIVVQFHTVSRNLPRRYLCSFVSFMAWTTHQILFGRSSQRENGEQDGRTSSRGLHYRSQEYEDGGNKLGIEKHGSVFWGMNGWSRQRGRHWWGMLHVCGENRNAYNNLVGKPEGKKLMVKPRNGRWEQY